VRFLPTLSPNLNPIEQAFAKTRQRLRHRQAQLGREGGSRRERGAVDGHARQMRRFLLGRKLPGATVISCRNRSNMRSGFRGGKWLISS
jgi:hypothetical protein